MSDFVHLQNHSDYSLLEAITTIKELVSKAKENNQKAIALTDNGVMYGIYEFYKECKKQEIKPIYGMDTYIAEKSHLHKSDENKGRRDYSRLLILAKNNEGYKNLTKLCSIGFIDGFYYKPRIDYELLKEYAKGLIITSGSTNGEIAKLIINSNSEEAKIVAKRYKDLFGEDFYLQIQNHGKQYDNEVCAKILEIGNELGIKTIATNDTFYPKKEYAIAHNVHLYIKDGGKVEIDETNLRMGNEEFYIKSTEQMYKLFPNNPEVLSNTLEIMEKCEVEFENKIFMPAFPIPETSNSTSEAEYLREISHIGIQERLGVISEEVNERLNYELDVIINMGFPGYFLIVWDFIKAARKIGVRVGPGRGSAAGSLVAYALKITDINPLEYDLLFERFLNPNRVSMPDIDIDFADNKRELVMEYVKQKYGSEAVALIITFGTLSSKAVLSDVGRVLKVSFDSIKKITANIPVTRGKVTPLIDAIKLPEVKEIIDDLKKVNPKESEKVDKLISYSLILEGRKRNNSIHAGGVVIAPSDISDYVPLSVPKKALTSPIQVATQFQMRELEEAGLLKMDFLGLRTLSIIENAIEMINSNYGINFNIDDLPLDDMETYEVFSSHTLGIFQFESTGMQEWLKKLKPQNLEEIAAMNALYRPGPMDNIGEYIDRKMGKSKVEYIHPILEKSMGSTYGILIYQEQVMKLVQDVANFTLAEADIFRKAMGKKDPKTMEEMKPKFINASLDNGIEKSIAIKIWDLIFKFAEYGFNKSHAVAYSFLAYKTAYLKAHYKAEFYAANLTAEIDDLTKIVAIIDEAKLFGIRLHSPDINNSKSYFFAKDNIIYYSLAAIKGIGVNVVDKIVEERENAYFESFSDFCSRLDDKVINRKALYALICSGAFDKLEHNRAKLFNGTDIAIDFSKSKRSAVSESMDSLFLDVAESNSEELILQEVEEWTNTEKLEKEREYLNFYISGHPLDEYELLTKTVNKRFENEDISSHNRKEILMLGLVSSIDIKINKDQEKFAILTVVANNLKLEVILWAQVYKRIEKELENHKIYFFEGKLDVKDNNPKLVQANLHTVESFLNKRLNKVIIKLNDRPQEIIPKLENLKLELSKPGISNKSFYFRLHNDAGQMISSYFCEVNNFKFDLNFLQKLSNLFDGRIKLIIN